jgi:hypothetical protein
MRDDQQDIIDYLKNWRGTFVSGKEIARKVGGKDRFEEDRGWAMPVLTQMVRTGLLETDFLGAYRLKPEEKKKREPQHVSPEILKILKSSGKTFDNVDADSAIEAPPIPAYRKPASPPVTPAPLPPVPESKG